MRSLVRVIPVVLLLVLSGSRIALPVAAQGQVYTDTMDSAETGLLSEQSSTPGIAYSYQNGQFLIQLTDPAFSGQALSFIGVPDMSDVRITVDAAMAGDTSNKYLVAGCRAADTSAGYYLAIGPFSGAAFLVRADAAGDVVLQQLADGTGVNIGNANNQIGIECVGSTITGIINGQNILSVTDATYAAGESYIGVGVQSNAADRTATVGFDNLTVTDLGVAAVQPTVAAPTVAAPTLAAPTVAAPTVAAQTGATSQTAPIRDPNVDPEGTLTDAFTISLNVSPVAGDLFKDATINLGFVNTFSAGVQVASFYGEMYYTTPTVPAGTFYLIGFAFWNDASGSYYDIYLRDDGTGNAEWGYGIGAADGSYQTLQSGLLPAGSVDPAPGASNFLSLTVYNGVGILSGNTFTAAAVIPLQGTPVVGDVDAEVGYIQKSSAPASTVPTLQISFAGFGVWDLSSGQVPLETGTAETPAAPEPVATTATLPTVAPLVPTTAALPTVPPAVQPPPTTAAATTGAPGNPVTSDPSSVIGLVRTMASANPPLVAGTAGVLTQTDAGYAWNSGGISAGDFYSAVSFTNPTDTATPFDVGIGFRAAAGSESGARLVIMSTGQWYLVVPNGETIDSGVAANFNPAPGAVNTIELIAQGNFSVFALNGVELKQAALPSSALNPGDVYIGAGFFQGDSVPGREVPWSNFWVYPLAA